MDFWQQFHGPNAAFVLELYERYQLNPELVDEATRGLFDQWQPLAEETAMPREASVVGLSNLNEIESGIAAASYVRAIRERGYLLAHVDPLGGEPPTPSLLSPNLPEPSAEVLRRLPAALIGGPLAANAADAWETVQNLRRIYSTASGYEYGHLQAAEERAWLYEATESGRYRPPQAPIDEAHLLERLTEVEVFERFLQQVFPGKTRFSIEGVDMLVPMLDEIALAATEARVRQIILGMGHRGRFNVQAHILQKPYAEILAEFKDTGKYSASADEAGWTGDVRYHAGGCRPVDADDENCLTICMPPNPSHLESIYPVVEGMIRAAGSQVERRGAPKFDPDIAMAVVLHGDASFSGQGIVAETLNLARLPAYQTGGTLHIIVNNQLGYTATPQEVHSGRYASDLALGFDLPVIHVNADVPEACLEAARIACAFRACFHKDFLIDLIGYRRYGHNEGDEPTFTQPVMYRRIQSHPTVREQWARRLLAQGSIEPTWAEGLVQKGMEAVRGAYQAVEAGADGGPWLEPRRQAAKGPVLTAVPLQRLEALNAALLEWPETFKLHRKLERSFLQRRQAFGDPDQLTIDWPLAEELALATILEEGIAIRLTGEDVGRGTFSQRHVVLYHADTGQAYIPLQAMAPARAACEVSNSPVTEMATVGFEFGYSLQKPEQLVLWEAQYGDFITVAQVMVDEFITSARAKWNQTSALVLLLPHGNEGQGPDHSSARLERFLQLAAGHNLQIAMPTTAAQYFHLLRRQAQQLTSRPLPLIVFTPKGLLRHPLMSSPPQALAQSGWQNVIDDTRHPSLPRSARRLLLCSGRVYVDLATSPLAGQTADQVAIARLEQIYPLPGEELDRLLVSYPRLESVVWVQEEPQNMGAWDYLRPGLMELIGGRWPLHCISRPPSPSPAEGSMSQYNLTQRALIQQALSVQIPLPAASP
jgi:2-oxoglutarate dehydrogenase E1 component